MKRRNIIFPDCTAFKANIFSMPRFKSLFGTAGLLLLLVSSAQSGPLCFRGRPECQNFLLTEFAVQGRIGGNTNTEGVNDFIEKVYYTMDLGMMHNLNKRYALGGTLYMGVDARFGNGGFWAMGLKPRLRYWLNPNLGLDVAPGLLLTDSEESDKTPSFTGSVSLSYKDLIALTTSFEVIRRDIYTYNFPNPPLVHRENLTSWYLGAKAESLPGIVTGVIGAGFLTLKYIINLSD